MANISNIVTHVRNGNATMVDSDGKIKWAPHNILAYSEDFSDVYWSNNTTAELVNSSEISGISVVNKLTSTTTTATINKSVSSTAADHTYSVFAKAGTSKYLYISVDGSSSRECYFDLELGTIVNDEEGTGTITPVGNNWYLCKVTGAHASSLVYLFGFSDSSSSRTVASGKYIYAAGAHVYRSDLGGMVNNPDRGDSYVPTTTAAKYMPRTGHHMWNGTEWVNEGYFNESETRTNYVDSNHNLQAYLANAAGESGESIRGLSMFNVIPLAGTIDTNTGQGIAAIGAAPVATTYNFSLFVKGGGGITNLRIRRRLATVDEVLIGFFNLDTGVATDSAGTIDVQDFGGGLYRLSWNATANAADVIAYTVKPDVTETADGINYFSVSAFQIEKASTPSSYIPTTGATATRPSELMTIPAANVSWPTPKVRDDTVELVTNGDASNGTTGWTTSGSVAVTNDKFVLEDISGTDAFISQQLIGIKTGDILKISFDHDVVGSRIFLQIGSGAGLNQDLQTTSNTTGTKIYIHVVQRDDPWITWRTFDPDQSNTIDNISVKEIDPLALSIQMEGRMSYPDNGEAISVRFFNWSSDVNNGIYVYMLSNSTEGKFQARQNSSNVADLVTIFSNYTYGTYVPFKVASLHGSTFINAAIGGITTTENNTPIELADLSSTDLQIGNDFMGTIKNFRIWTRRLLDHELIDYTT